MFSEKELFILSNGLLGLIDDIGNAKRFVHDDDSHAALDNEAKMYRDLNSRLMSMVEKMKDFASPRWIQIWYSWGDQESPVEVPAGVDPWEYMKHLAANEAEIDFMEHEDCGSVGLAFYPDVDEIHLRYADGEYCFYKITDTEEFDPDADD